MKLSDLREIARFQKEVAEAGDTGLDRDILPDLPDIKTHALILSGIRRCGKSTLLHQFVRSLERGYFYLTFEDLRLADFTNDDYALLDILIAESSSGLLFFDEIQAAPRWERYVRQKLDEGFQVLLTGSNASLLSRELGNKLTGRHLSRELFPFSYREYVRFTGMESGAASLDSYLVSGGFPEYLKTGRDEILEQLQKDILYRDIAVRYGIRDVASLRHLYTYLVSNAAQLVSPSKLTQVAGVKSPSTILEYFSYFESSYLFTLAPRFAWSVKARSVAPKKLYVTDPGIIRTGSVSGMKNSGALLENFVFNQLRLSNTAIYYFADGAGECDFIVPSPKNAKPDYRCIQVCNELHPDNEDREIRGLITAMEFFNQREGTIITRDSRDRIIKDGRTITVAPAWEFAAT
jgi:predicted AAA+ superfamily ATPase